MMERTELARNCELPLLHVSQTEADTLRPRKRKKPPGFQGDSSNVEVALR